MSGRYAHIYVHVHIVINFFFFRYLNGFLHEFNRVLSTKLRCAKENAEDNEAKLEEMSRKLEELEKSRQEVCYCLPYVLHILHGFEGDMPEYLLEVTGKTRSGMSPDD